MKRLAPLAAVCTLLACGSRKDASAPSLTMPDLAYHSAHYFPVSPGDVHGPAAGQPLTTCNQCHADRSSGQPPYPPSASFKTFTCTGCHVVADAASGVSHDDIAGLATLPDHAGQAAFDPAQPLAFDRACLGCHPDGRAEAPAYHAQLFPIDAASKHAGIGCSSCHGTNRADLTQLQCASCHADPTKSPTFPTRHDPVIDASNGGSIAILVELTPPPPASCTPAALPPLTSPDCLKCHALSHVDHVELSPASGGHPVTDAAFGHDQHEGAGCFTCHVATTQITATVSPPTPPPSGDPAADFTQPSPASQSSPGCATCHSYGCGPTGN